MYQINDLEIFLLIFIRMISFIVIVPVFGQKNIPNMTKIALAFYLSVIIMGVHQPYEIIINNNSIYNYTILVIQQIFVGWLLGFGVYLVFTIITLAGNLIDSHIGFSMVNVFDPMSQYQISITANFYYYLLLLILLTTNMYYVIIQGIVESFYWIPIDQLKINIGLFGVLTKFFTDYFIIAFKISGPVFAGVLIINVVLGVLARTVPQMNMFVVGIPLKVLVGLLILLSTIVFFPTIADMIFEQMMQVIDSIIRGLSP